MIQNTTAVIDEFEIGSENEFKFVFVSNPSPFNGSWILYDGEIRNGENCSRYTSSDFEKEVRNKFDNWDREKDREKVRDSEKRERERERERERILT